MVMSLSAITLVTGRFPQPDRDTADVSDVAGARIARAGNGGRRPPMPSPKGEGGAEFAARAVFTSSQWQADFGTKLTVRNSTGAVRNNPARRISPNDSCRNLGTI